MNENQRKMVLDWMRKIHILEHAHRLESIMWKKWNNKLGIPIIVLGLFIGVISSICEIKNLLFVSIVSSVGGFIVATVTGIQTFVKPMKMSEKHMNLSYVYETLRHKIELFLEFESDSLDDIESKIENLRSEWEQIKSLNVTQKHFNLAKKWIKEMNIYPSELEFLNKNIK